MKGCKVYTLFIDNESRSQDIDVKVLFIIDLKTQFFFVFFIFFLSFFFPSSPSIFLFSLPAGRHQDVEPAAEDCDCELRSMQAEEMSPGV